MVATTQQTAAKPDLDAIKKMAAAAVFGVQERPESKDGVSGAGTAEDNEGQSNGMALNGSSPPAVPAGYSQTGENFIGTPPSQVVPNTSFPSLPPPEVARTIPCRFWPECRYGDECAFAHDPQLASSNAGAPSGPSPVPALPTPQDSPTTSSPPQMMSASQQGPPSVHQAMMGGFYYPYPPAEHMPMQDFYGMSSPPPFQPMHQTYFYPHAPQFQSPPPQQAPLDPRAQYPGYGYPAYPQPQGDRPPTSPMHAGVPTAPRAQQQAQNGKAMPQHAQSIDEPMSTSPQEHNPSSELPPQVSDLSSPSAEQANGMPTHTFFQTAPYANEAVMAASGIPPSRQPFASDQQRSSLSSSANRRTSSLPGSAFSSSKPKFSQPRHAMPCTFFTINKCRNGDSCPFAHMMPDGSDAKAQKRDIIGPDGTSGDPHVLEQFKRTEGARRDTARFEKNNSGRVRQETYPGGFRDSRFGLVAPGAMQKDAPRGRFGLGQVNGQQEAGKEQSARPASLPGVSRAANQRVPNGADFPALPAPTTPVSEKVADFPSQESDKSEEAPAMTETISPPSEAAPVEPAQVEAAQPAANQKMTFSFASAAARGASVPPPQKKQTQRQQVNHSDNLRSTTDKAPMPVAVA